MHLCICFSILHCTIILNFHNLVKKQYIKIVIIVAKVRKIEITVTP